MHVNPPHAHTHKGPQHKSRSADEFKTPDCRHFLENFNTPLNHLVDVALPENLCVCVCVCVCEKYMPPHTHSHTTHICINISPNISKKKREAMNTSVEPLCSRFERAALAENLDDAFHDLVHVDFLDVLLENLAVEVDGLLDLDNVGHGELKLDVIHILLVLNV